MRTIKLTIQYDGAGYSGWQFQENAVSIQRTIEKALRGILSENVRVIGASRTDAGVHAKGQAAHFKTYSRLDPQAIKRALNSRLPKDIIITNAKRVPVDFNAQYDARSKLYRYTIANASIVDPFTNRLAARVACALNIDAMRRAARHIVGKRNFRSFQSKAGSCKNSTRTIHKIGVKKKGNLLMIDIEADGFLYNMARSIVGTLIEVGRGRFSPSAVRRIVSARDRRFAGPTAPAKGLCLLKVRY